MCVLQVCVCAHTLAAPSLILCNDQPATSKPNGHPTNVADLLKETLVSLQVDSHCSISAASDPTRVLLVDCLEVLIWID